MLDGYKPPLMKAEVPTETPAGSWRRNYRERTTEKVSATPPRVNTMPSYFVNSTYANALVGQAIAVWGNVHDGVPPMRYILDYGDGTVDSGDVADPNYVGADHTYATAGTRTIALTVRDNLGTIDIDQSTIRVYAVPTPQIRANIAIEKGLRYLYLNQYAEGYWVDNSDYLASTGAALLSFEENGHKPANNNNTDIYAEYVRAGLNWLWSYAQTYGIYGQEAGNPDTDGDGLGSYLDGNTYANGLAELAVLGAYSNAVSAQSDTIRVGAYDGKTFYDFMVNAVDQWSFSQTDPSSGADSGGWRYAVNTPNYGSSDNSTTQWASLVLEAAENSWGIVAPQFVKNELQGWLNNSQASNGGFFYSTQFAQDWTNITKTAAALGGYAYIGATTANPAVDTAIGFLNDQWNLTGLDVYGWAQHMDGNTYAMYGVAKGLRIIDHRAGTQFVRSHDWYSEYRSHLLDNLTWGQNADGSWPRSGNYPTAAMGDPLNSSLAILVLTQGVVIAPPVAVIAPVGAKPPNIAFQVDGSGSFHQDPAKSIVEYLWDWDASNGLDWVHPDAVGPRPTNPGYPTTSTYTITLRVKDNGDPPLYDTQTRSVVIRTGNTPPVAVAIPPNRGPSYAGKVGEPILLDGRASYDPDYPLDSVAFFSWDTNGDLHFGDATSDTVTVIYYTEQNGEVGLRVTDTRSDSSQDSAYIRIVSSLKDLFVVRFDFTLMGGMMDLKAVFKNDPSSDVDVSQVLVRFYDGDPLTTGTKVGSDFHVNLPRGATDSIETTIPAPSLLGHPEHDIYVYLDANDQVPEWNEQNNLAYGSLKSELSIQSGWNLVSVPSSVVDRRKNSLFPSARSSAFKYTTLYVPVDSLAPGRGYWLKFDSAQTVEISGLPIMAETIVVKQGWNMIGSISTSVAVNSISTIPDSIISSPYYGYDSNGYYRTSAIAPGSGYWVKTRDSGTVILTSTGPSSQKALSNVSAESLGRLDAFTFKDANGREQSLRFGRRASIGLDLSLFELPPVPPPGSFDARFASNRMLEVVEEGKTQDFPVLLSSAKYPIIISWALKSNDVAASLIIDGKEVSMKSNGSTQITHPTSHIALRLTGAANLPKEFALEQNYPNPFNPITKINYALPKNAKVSLKIYDILGQEIITLVEEIQEAGYKSVEWNSTNNTGNPIASGVYFYQLEATSVNDLNKTFTKVRKMLLVR